MVAGIAVKQLNADKLTCSRLRVRVRRLKVCSSFLMFTLSSDANANADAATPQQLHKAAARSSGSSLAHIFRWAND